MNEPTPLQRTVDSIQWHDRKTCREHPMGTGGDPDGARDRDGIPVRDKVLLWAVARLREEAKPCLCGSVPGFHLAKDAEDQSHIFCSNKRCGRIVPCGPRTLTEGIAEWNSDDCPMCGGSINSDTKECPRCKEAVR